MKGEREEGRCFVRGEEGQTASALGELEDQGALALSPSHTHKMKLKWR